MTMTELAPETTTETYEIVEDRFEECKERIERLNKRARKLGVPGLTYEVTGRFVKDVDTGREDWKLDPIVLKVPFVTVEVTGATPKIAGYTFAATIEHTKAGNILHSVPGAGLEAPARFRETGRVCEHCGYVRDRKDTYLVFHHESQTWKQVGKTCLKDYLGEDVDAFLNRLGWWNEIALFGEVDPDEWGWGGGHRCEPLYHRSEFLRAVAILVRTEGWVSRTKARASNEMLTATADRALWLLSPSVNRDDANDKHKVWSKSTPEDAETAQKTLEFVRTEWLGKPVQERSEYEHNVAAAIADGDEEDTVSRRQAGLVGSAVFCYYRAVEKEIERKEEEKNLLNEHFGEVGGGDEIGVYTRGAKKGQPKFRKGYELTLTILAIIDRVDEFDGFTTYIHKMRDADGRTFTWFGSRHLETDERPEGDEGFRPLRPAERGDTVKAVWNVKAHNEFKGRKETIVNRPRKEELVAKRGE